MSNEALLYPVPKDSSCQNDILHMQEGDLCKKHARIPLWHGLVGTTLFHVTLFFLA